MAKFCEIKNDDKENKTDNLVQAQRKFNEDIIKWLDF